MVLIHPPRLEGDPYFDRHDRDYSHAYHHIVRRARAVSFSTSLAASSASAAVLILVSPDPDAICAAKVLARLLTEDDIPYRIVPVDGYTTLQNVIEDDVVGNEELHTLIFLNLGSVLSLSSYFISTRDAQAQEEDEEEEVVGFPLPDKCTLHVLDSHRPWNLDNLFATSELMERIFVWDDGEVKERLAPEAEAYERLEFDWGLESEDEDDDDSEEEESEEEDQDEDGSDYESVSESDGEGGRIRKRRKIRDGDDEDGEGSTSSRRRRKRKEASKPKKMTAYERQRLEAVLSRYYHRGTTLGLAVSGMTYLLAVKLGRVDNDALWMAILGLTWQYTSNQIPFDMYEQQAEALASDVIANNPTAAAASADGPVTSLGFNPDDTSIRVIPQELRFTLFRHWSLENSMYHTSYVAAKLNIWKEAGMSRLRGLLAKMGFSLANCRQTYEHMDLDLRKTLVGRMDNIAPEYGLTELVYRSFLRNFGFKAAPLSAADAVEGICALLQAAFGVRLEVDTPGMTFAAACANGTGAHEMRYNAVPGALHASELFGARRVWNLSGAAGGDDKTSSGASAPGKENRPPAAGAIADRGAQDKQGQQDLLGEPENQTDNDLWVKNFFAAYNALDSRKLESINLLQASLSLSKSLHRAVISTGVSLITKHAIRTLRSFRLAVLKDGPDLALYTHPAMLTRLTLWLIDALRDALVDMETKRNVNRRLAKKRRAMSSSSGKASGGADDPSTGAVDDTEPTPDDAPMSLPFVVAALNQRTNRYLVVGVSGATDYGDTRRNKFGLAFQDAAQQSGATTQHDRFETTVIDINADHLSAFVEALHVKA